VDFKVEAHGDGYSSLGALTFFLQKTVSAAGALHGCLTLSTHEGDSLFAICDATQGQPNANNFVTDGTGTLTFNGGTGLFKGVKGQTNFTAVFSLPEAIRQMVLELDRRFPGLGRQIEESMAAPIDGEIFEDACLTMLNPDLTFGGG
jgi:hypothetical protein